MTRSKSTVFGLFLGSTALSTALAAPAAPNDNERRAPSVSKDVIIQMFEWNWDSIATECTQYIGPNGYGYVQVSPAQDHVTGSQWWTDYQPVSYTLTSKRGDRAQYQNMITACHNAGVKVIADTIFNHMTGESSGTGIAGDSFTQYVYPGTYESQDFHYCGLEPNNDIVNYDNEQEVWTCQLDGLADLATDTTYVQQRLAEYANDLISLGVDGLRLDAAKHMDPSNIAAILAQLTTKPYVTQEVIWGSGEPVTPALYTGNGDVQEFRYTTAIMNAFLNYGISTLVYEDLNSQGWVDTSVANVFVANHDTERNSGASLNYLSPSNTYTLAHVFMMAYPYGTPTVTSGYTWSGYDDGAPNGNAGTCYGAGGVNGWLCEHRWPAIVGMVGFRNTVQASSASTALGNYVSPSTQQIAFGRGAVGFVVINNVDSTWSSTFSTSLPDGTYCDVAAGVMSGGTCAGASYTVSGGTFTATVANRSALALHTGAKL